MNDINKLAEEYSKCVAYHDSTQALAINAFKRGYEAATIELNGTCTCGHGEICERCLVNHLTARSIENENLKQDVDRLKSQLAIAKGALETLLKNHFKYLNSEDVIKARAALKEISNEL